MLHLKKEDAVIKRLQTLNLKGERRMYPSHSVLLDHGKAGQRGIFLVSGQARVFLLTLSGEKRLISYPGPGSFLGENALFSIGMFNWNLFVEAVTPCEVVEMSKNDILENVSHYPEIFTSLMESASAKQSNLLTQLQCATHFSVPLTEQVVSLLFALARESSEGKMMIQITHEEISQMIGRSRVAITNTLGKLQDQGYIEIHRGQITIVKPQDLWAIIGQ